MKQSQWQPNTIDRRPRLKSILDGGFLKRLYVFLWNNDTIALVDGNSSGVTILLKYVYYQQNYCETRIYCKSRQCYSEFPREAIRVY